MINDIVHVVDILNEKYYNDEYTIFEMNTDGYTIIIKCCGFVIWNNEDDDREFDENKNEYELLVPFLIKRSEKLIKYLYNIMIKEFQDE
jgi:hypothetical protein